MATEHLCFVKKAGTDTVCPVMVGNGVICCSGFWLIWGNSLQIFFLFQCHLRKIMQW